MTYPGARRPDRSRTVSSGGLRLAVYEWGPEDGPPILMAHGGFDFAGTFDVFAPMLADGGYRVRGVGRTAATATPSTPSLYTWDADLRDALVGARHRDRPSRCRSSATPRAAALMLRARRRAARIA